MINKINKMNTLKYLLQHNITNEEQLLLHVEQLERNTFPDVNLIEGILSVSFIPSLEKATVEPFTAEKPKNYNSTRHKYNPESDAPKFSRNIQDALQRAEEYQAQFGRKETEEAERFNALTEESLKDDVITNSSRGEKEMFKEIVEGRGIAPLQIPFPTFRLATAYKETEGKLDYSEINLELFDLMAKRFADNKHKYEAGNTKKPLDIKQIEQAAFRHLRKMIQPIEGDEETYTDHLVAVTTNMSIILDQLKLNKS